MSDSSDAAVRALHASALGARERRPEDATDPTVPTAATVVLLRDGDDGVEVLLLRRPDRGSFAGAWVFPGGKLDAEDAGETEAEVARAAGVRETAEEIGLAVDGAAFETLAVWDPPPGIRLRIRTWFFVAEAPDAPLTLSPDEVAEIEWMRPADALERHGRGELVLYPPTWVTLHGLTLHTDVAALLAAARLRGIERFETVARVVDSGPAMVWAGDAVYATAEGDGSAARHRIELATLPWRYSRTS